MCQDNRVFFGSPLDKEAEEQLDEERHIIRMHTYIVKTNPCNLSQGIHFCVLWSKCVGHPNLWRPI